MLDLWAGLSVSSRSSATAEFLVVKAGRSYVDDGKFDSG